MRTWIPASAVLLSLALAPAAPAAAPIDRWAKTNHLKGKWRAKDADRDGVKNRREYELRTNPRRRDSDRDKLRDGDELKVGMNPLRADSDRDGIRDGNENAGVITAYDGATIAIRRFHGGPLRARLEADSRCAGPEAAEEDAPLAVEESVEDEVVQDEEYVEVTEDAQGGDPHWAEEPDDQAPSEEIVALEEEPVEIDLGGDDDYGYAGCEDPRLKPGAIVTSAVVEAGVATEVSIKSSK